jgi:hypothetical protein
METKPPSCFELFPLLLPQRDWFSQTVEPAKPISRPATQASVSRWRSPTAPRASSILPRITGALKDLVAKPDRRDEMPLLTLAVRIYTRIVIAKRASVLDQVASTSCAIALVSNSCIRPSAVKAMINSGLFRGKRISESASIKIWVPLRSSTINGRKGCRLNLLFSRSESFIGF